MREMLELAVEPRQGKGKGPAYQVREKGLVPGIVYGGEAEPEPITIDGHQLERHASKGTFLSTLFVLDMAGRKTRVIPRQVQLHPVTDRPVHVDFMRLPEGARIKLAIPVRFKGQESSPGIKRGGVLNIIHHEVELLCPAENIPEFIEGDLSVLDIHGSLHISSFNLPEGVVPTSDQGDFSVASIVAPTSVIEEQRAAAAGTPAAAVAEGATPAAPAAGAAGAAPAAGAAAKGAAGAAAKGPAKK